MERIFNITGSCNPQQNYMVNLDSRLAEIKKMIDRGDYFTINRGRQYGKTTIIRALASYLSEDYFVISMDFQFVSHSDFVSESAFVRGFARELWCQREMREMIIPEIQSQIKSLKQIGVEYTFTLDFFPRTGKSLICSQRRISVETSQRMLSIQGYRGTLSAWFFCPNFQTSILTQI